MMMLQALSGGKPNPLAIQSQMQLMRRLGSPIYANSPLRGPSSAALPFANPFNAQAQQAFAPVPQPMQRPA
jgi:hypothetical protein